MPKGAQDGEKQHQVARKKRIINRNPERGRATAAARCL
jgi:hypothetical protein